MFGGKLKALIPKMLWWKILGDLNDENVRKDRTPHIVFKLLCLYNHQSIDSFSLFLGSKQ